MIPAIARSTRRARWFMLVVVTLLSLVSVAHADEMKGTIKVKLKGADTTVNIVQNQDGTHSFVLQTGNGEERLSPEDFAHRVFDEQTSRGWFQKLFNITSPMGILWVSIGIIGQLLFTGRMIVQWISSEKSRKSVVPPAFWWMSLIGATMLMIYFVWRKDIVGVAGQGTGWFIYVRNIYFIHLSKKSPPITEDPAPQAELDA